MNPQKLFFKVNLLKRDQNITMRNKNKIWHLYNDDNNYWGGLYFNCILFLKNKTNFNTDSITFLPCLIPHLNLKGHFPRIFKATIVFPSVSLKSCDKECILRKYQNTLLKKISCLPVFPSSTVNQSN